jgi:very-short-patch-repair endonuclease
MTRSGLAAALAHDVGPRTYQQLCAEKSEGTARRAISTGVVVRLLPDQYCLALHAESWSMRARAAVAWAGPAAALSGLAALGAYRYAPLPIDGIDIVVPAGAHRPGPGWLRVRSLTVPFTTAVWAPRTAMVRPSLALALAYGHVDPRYRAQLVHGAVREGLVDPREMESTIATLPRLAARKELRVRLARIAAGAESYLEERGMADVFRGDQFADLVFQHRVRVRDERFRIDAVDLPTLTAFELDGKEGHAGEASRQANVTRDGLLASLGYLTVRFTFKDVTTRPEWCRDLALEVIASRRNGR